MKEYPLYDAVALAELVKTGQVAPRELMEAAIEQCTRLNPKLNAVTYLAPDALEAADKTKAAGAFSGVPFLIKDMSASVEGMPVTQGSKLLAGYIADYDSEIVRRYRKAGLMIFGKTNVPEFGICVSSESAFLGAVKNPFDLSRTAGGSSGGSAAAVAAGIVPAAHASDGGGSIRIPASCCGLFGVKPTRGRNPNGPKGIESWAGLAVEHVVSRTVRDSAWLLDSTKGPDTGAYNVTAPAPLDFRAALQQKLPRLKIGFFEQTDAALKPHPECLAAVKKTLGLLEDAGHTVIRIQPKIDPETVARFILDVIGGNLVFFLREIAGIKKVPVEALLGYVEPVTAALYQMGLQKTAADYVAAVTGIQRFVRQFATQTSGVDMLVSPVLADVPAKLGHLAMTNPDLEDYLERQYRFSPFTALFNYTGQPAASLPMHVTAEGLPVGVQIAGPYAREDLLFQLSAELEPYFVRPTCSL